MKSGEDDFSIEVVDDQRREWADEAVIQRERVATAWRDLGSSEEQVEIELAAYDEKIAPIWAVPSITERRGVHGIWGRDPDVYTAVRMEEWRERHRRAATALQNMLRRTQRRELERTVVDVELPLFLLGSPPVQGSSVTYTESRSESATSGWTIVVFGTGMGADRTLTLKSSGAFTARDGACKRIFLPAKLAVSRIGVFKRGKMLHEGTRTELVEASGTASPELLSGGDPPEFDDEREPVRYQLARDTSGDHAVYELSSEVADTFDLQLGVEAFKSKITFDTSVNGRKEASLKFDLPSGVDYCFRYLKRPSGMLCIAPALQGRPQPSG